MSQARQISSLTELLLGLGFHLSFRTFRGVSFISVSVEINSGRKLSGQERSLQDRLAPCQAGTGGRTAISFALSQVFSEPTE